MDSSWCCAGPLCCACMCGVCMRCCRTSHQNHIRIGYLGITVLAVFFALIFLYFGADLVSPWEGFGYGKNNLDCYGETKTVCLSLTTIYRESFSLCVFYFIMAFLSLKSERLSSLANRMVYSGSCWGFKILFISVLLIMSFFIPNSFFVVFT